MTMKGSVATLLSVVVGLVAGIAIYHGALLIGGQQIVSDTVIEDQLAELNLLRRENEELTDELLRPRMPGRIEFSKDNLPYAADADAWAALSAAKSAAVAEGKFLMVTFGANWCLDCRTLHHRLNTEPAASYVADRFVFVNVDVGKFNRNRDVAESLGVSLNRGIPVAVIFSPDGELIGTTDAGQLEPSRHYSSEQILKFVRDVVERSRILAPDSIG